MDEEPTIDGPITVTLMHNIVPVMVMDQAMVMVQAMAMVG